MNSHEFIRRANAAARRCALRSRGGVINLGDVWTAEDVERWFLWQQRLAAIPAGRRPSFSEYTADRMLYDMRVGLVPLTPTE